MYQGDLISFGTEDYLEQVTLYSETQGKTVVGVKSESVVKDEAREVDRGQLMQSPLNHGHKFGLYFKLSGKPLKGFKYRSGMINMHIRHIPSCCGMGMDW